jgi:tryptophan halogenase
MGGPIFPGEAPMSEISKPGARTLRIVILGGGTAGWMAAAGLRRQLNLEQYPITLIESDEIGTVGVGEATLPHIKLFNDGLGLNEAEFMRATHATFKLGIQFRDWDQPGGSYIHPFGAFGEPWSGVEFQHQWLKAARRGDPGPLQDYSYSVVAARSNAFEFPNSDSKSIRSTYAYAYHFDAGLYAAHLRAWAMGRGVSRIEGQVLEVKQHSQSGEVTGLLLKSGELVTGELFIDCSGFRSLLLGKTLGVGWQDWTHWLPCDRAFAVPSRRVDPMTPYTRATAREAGWSWRIPLQHRTGNGYVFSSRFTDEETASRVVLAGLDAEPLGEPRLLKFLPGRRVRAWSQNCVAIGLASGFLEPLESTSIFLVQAAVTDLISLLPRPGGPATDRRLAAEFNRLNEMQYERVRDFLVLHYFANGRLGQPLWDYVRTMAIPDSLQQKLDLFRSRAALPNYQFGLFSRDSWLSVLAGQGVKPMAYDRLADALPDPALSERLQSLRQRIASNVASMSGHSDFVAGYCESRMPSKEVAA